MTQTEFSKGSRTVIVLVQGGEYYARLYVENGETPTLQKWKGRNKTALDKWVEKVLAV